MSQGCTVPIKTSAVSSTTSLGINLLVMRDTGVWLHGSVTLPQFRLTLEYSAYRQLLSQGKWLQTFITVSVSSLHQSQDQVQLLSSSKASLPSRDIWNMQAYARDRTATNFSPRAHSHKTWSSTNVSTRTHTDRQTGTGTVHTTMNLLVLQKAGRICPKIWTRHNPFVMTKFPFRGGRWTDC
jgi:hypothetical protein